LQSRSLLVPITDTNTTPASQEQGESKHLRISVQQSESGESVGDQRQGRTWLREQGRSDSGGVVVRPPGSAQNMGVAAAWNPESGVASCSSGGADPWEQQYGQPVGKNYRQLSTVIGCMVRKKLSVHCSDWRLIDAEENDAVWDEVQVNLC